MRSKVAFTICAKNYVGLALILERSLKEHDPDTDFIIFIADEVGEDIKQLLPSNAYVARDILPVDNTRWDDMSFKYNLTEFCTSIKPFCFRWLFDNTQYDNFIYLDPDIYIFNSFASVYDSLRVHSIILTPHILDIQISDNGEGTQKNLMNNGIFNLGFIGFSRSRVAENIINWWSEKLLDSCFIDILDSLFTDQKWMDFMPAFVNSQDLDISRNMGLNVAPWNYYEREIVLTDGRYRVKSRRHDQTHSDELVFVHYSGYDYTELKKGSVIQNNIPSLANYPDIQQLTTDYAEAICKQNDVFDRFIAQSYTYGTYSNGDTVQTVHRRLYRELNRRGETFRASLFDTGIGTFHSLMLSRKMIMNKGVNLDKVTKHNLGGVESKLRSFNYLTRMLYKVLGYQRYMLLIRLLRPFARYESQIHLLDKKYDKNNIY